MEVFTTKYRSKIAGSLSGFDRLIFRGTLRPLAHAAGLQSYLTWAGILLKDFRDAAWRICEEVKEAAKVKVREAGRPVIHLRSSGTDKLGQARKIMAKDGIEEGPVVMFTSVESCYSFELEKDAKSGWLRLVPARRKCLFLYRYDVHPHFGLMHMRLQSGFPFQLQVYLNGREWLARQMNQAGLGYKQCENCFVWLEDFQQAQGLADRQLKTAWAEILTQCVQPIHPLHSERFGLYRYYWSMDESEYATDILFNDPTFLARMYPLWLQQGMTTFRSPDVMRFLSSREQIHGRFQGQIVTDVKQRAEGIRIKHRIDHNSVKAYDKYGLLRVETTLSQTRPFKVYRRLEGQPDSPLRWRRMRKGVADIHRRAEVSRQSNHRYLDALASVVETTPVRELTDRLCRRVQWKGQLVRAINPFHPEDRQLLQAISDGKFTIHGFCNRDLRQILYGVDSSDSTLTRRRSAQVTRQLRLLRAHGLLRKKPGTHRYDLTPKGRQITTTLLTLNEVNLKQINEIAA
jgi:hypothetical protein